MERTTKVGGAGRKQWGAGISLLFFYWLFKLSHY